MTADLTPAQRTLQLAVRAGLPSMQAVTYTPQLQTMCELSAAEQQQSTQRIERVCRRMEHRQSIAGCVIVGLVLVDVMMQAAQMMA